MEMFFVFAIFMLMLSPVMPDHCPDSSSCPGAEPCCPSALGYNCCPLTGGSCCADGVYCCPRGYFCVAWLDICILAPSNKIQMNSATMKSTLPKKKTAAARIGECPSRTTWCTKGPREEKCCPLPDAVCCSDQIHCCPKGYACDLSQETCTKSSIQPSQYLPISVTNLKFMYCPDGKQCLDHDTCCLKENGHYGCCMYPQAVCCSDKKHCCPNGTSCDVKERRCVKGTEIIPWIKKMPAIKGERFNNSLI